MPFDWMKITSLRIVSVDFEISSFDILSKPKLMTKFLVRPIKVLKMQLSTNEMIDLQTKP